ncbi:hypothetical protein [Larkinella harenae]
MSKTAPEKYRLDPVRTSYATLDDAREGSKRFGLCKRVCQRPSFTQTVTT